jgi:hypothetical protein
MTDLTKYLPAQLRGAVGGEGVAQQAKSSAMTLPPLNLNTASNAGAGDVWASFATDTNGGAFSVNYGSGVSQGGGVSPLSGAVSPLLLIGGLFAGLILWKRFS